jgi:CubicO group peptidase (beta-lactamase class C family)
VRIIYILVLSLLSTNSWALDYEGKYLSNSLIQQLETWKQNNKSVNGVYLSGAAWVANSGTDVRCSSSGTFQMICLTMSQIAAAGGVTMDFAQAQSGEFIILSTNGAHYSHRAYFESLGIVAAIDQLTLAQKRVNSVALFENGGWLLIAQGEVKFKNLPASLYTALEEARLGDHFLTRINTRFNLNNETEWFLSSGSDYWTNQTNAYLQTAIHKFLRQKYYIGPVSIDGPRFVALVNHKRYLEHAFDLFENDIRKDDTTTASHILDRMEYYRVPGVTVAIIDGDKITTRTYGVLNNSSKLKAGTTSYYPSASLSKAVFSYGMLKAHERGILNLDQTLYDFAKAHPHGLVSKWVDSLPSTRAEPYEYNSKWITLRSLLSHSGGTSVHGIGLYRRNQMRSLSDLIMGTNGRSKTNPIRFPGVSILYSGGGYSLAEAALEDVTGQSASHWLALNVLAPLKMENSTFSYLHPTREINFARGHSANSRPIAVSYCPGKGAGGLVTNAYDYAKFLWSVMNDARIYQSNQRFLSRPSHQQVFTPAYRRFSSLENCRPGQACQKAGEICSLNKCVAPLTESTWYRHHGPGQMHARSRIVVVENNQSLYYPTYTEHGGGQEGIRTKFFYRYASKKGIVIFTNAEHSWIDGSDIERGGDPLVNEMIAAFARHW